MVTWCSRFAGKPQGVQALWNMGTILFLTILLMGKPFPPVVRTVAKLYMYSSGMWYWVSLASLASLKLDGQWMFSFDLCQLDCIIMSTSNQWQEMLFNELSNLRTLFLQLIFAKPRFNMLLTTPTLDTVIVQYFLWQAFSFSKMICVIGWIWMQVYMK